MDIFYTCAVSLLFVVVTITLHSLYNKSKPAVKGKVPPGRKGWFIIGETLEFAAAGLKGHPEKFFFDRMAKFSPHVFRTSLIREDVAVFCGAAGNKFLFSNENKLVREWYMPSLDKILNQNQSSYIKFKKVLSSFFMPETLHQYVPVVDMVTQKHFENEWDDKNQIVTYELTCNHTFSLACKMFLGIDEPEVVKSLYVPFQSVAHGIFSIPIDLPGTSFRRGINAGRFIRKELVSIIRQRKAYMINANASPAQDLLSHTLLASDKDNNMTEMSIADGIMSVLFASHETTSSTIPCVVKYLAELPEVFEGVYTEQMEIAKFKGLGEQLNWNDISKMKYSWNVAREVLRLVSPAIGFFREAITDFEYNGYFIPKGWKLYWSAVATHKNPEYFPEPQKFDPSRFDGKGPAPYTFVPFGGGPHICVGKEFARIQILVFMHHLVTKFKWEKVIPDEKVVVNPFPLPAKGLPIRLYPRTT